MAYKRICRVCGKEYEYCPNCTAFATQPKWRMNWDSEMCKAVWDIIVRYNTEHISKDEVKAVLDSYGIENYSVFNKMIASELKKIFAESKKSDREKNTKE